MTDMASFMTKVLEDNAFAAALNTHVGSVQGGDAEMAFCSFASDHGYQVTVNDIETLRKTFAELNDLEGDLSDDDLSKVSGGLAYWGQEWDAKSIKDLSNIINCHDYIKYIVV